MEMVLVAVVSSLVGFLSAVGAEARKLRSDKGTSTSRLSSKRSNHLTAVSISLGVVSLVAVVAILLLTWIIFMRRRFSTAKDSGRNTSSGSQPVQFSFKAMVIATNNFSERIGAGILGCVYRGLLLDNTTLVAVKKLSNYRGTDEEFRKFISDMSLVSHENLVKLHGFSSESNGEKLLVYEFLPNGSLDKFLFQESFHLNWTSRISIALSVARALEYLHQLQPPVVHGNLKVDNVLLDKDFQAKVCGTGLGSLVDRKALKTAVNEDRMHGFASPEWVADAPLSIKSDVYCFGIVLLEIVAGRRVIDLSKSSEEEWNFVAWAKRQVKAGNYGDLIDSRLGGEGEEDKVVKVIDVALRCIQDEAEDRPLMSEVVAMLESVGRFHENT